MEYEPQEGVDYIVDLYAATGVDRDAPELKIKQALRERLREYHPDRMQGLAPEIRAQGEEMTRTLNRANEILLDESKRHEYDEILNTWDGPVSETGTPIVRADRILQARFQGFLPEEVEGFFEEQIERIHLMLGYSPQRLDFLQKLIDESGEEIPADLRAEYEAALFQKDQVLAIEEAERSQLLGIPRVTDRQLDATHGYAALISSAIEDARQTRRAEAERLAIGGTATRLALLTGEADPTVSPSAISGQAEALPPYFDDQATKIRRLAEQREEVLEARLGNLTLAYPLAEIQTEYTGNLALGIQGKEQTTWIAIRVKDDDSGEGATLPEEVEDLLTQKEYRAVVEKGYNLAIVKYMEQVDLHDLVRVATGKYVDERSRREPIIAR